MRNLVLTKHTSRSKFLFLAILFVFAILVVRLFYLQILKVELDLYANTQHRARAVLKPNRGSIYDRNKVPLAMSRSVYTVKAVPCEIEQPEQMAEQLHAILGVEPKRLERRLKSNRKAVYLKRKIDDDQFQILKDKQFKGLYFDEESQRTYPKDSLASHVVGVVNVDTMGIEGIERYFNEELKGLEGLVKFTKDGRSRELLPFESDMVHPRDGLDLVLTIDEKIQYIVEREMRLAFEQDHPKSISVVVMDPRNGHILALANVPDFNPNQSYQTIGEERRNRVLTDMYEPGSTFKMITFAAALNEDVVDGNDVIFCENGSYAVKGRKIPLHDHHPHGDLTVTEVLQKSSNIGTVKIAQKLGPAKLYEYIKQFGFGHKTGLFLPGEANGHIRPLKQWSDASIAAVPMGQEVAVTPMQMMVAASTIANKGVMMEPMLVQSLMNGYGDLVKMYQPRVVRRVIDEDVAITLAEMLEKVVSSAGTARKASIEGVRVGGKTGTAQKFDTIHKQYSKRLYMASFIGFFPVEEPKLCIGVFVDEPPYAKRYGGTIAALIFQKIGRDILFYLNETV